MSASTTAATTLPHRRQRTWLLLAGLTVLAAALVKHLYYPWTLWLLGITFVKGQLVVDEYMGLRWVQGYWRRLVLGYLVVVLTAIALVQWLTGA